jgi:CHRD domain-containing protein
VRTLVAAAGVALVLTGLASAAPQADTYKLAAAMTGRAEVPKPTGVPAGAKGLFTGKAVELANDRARLTWRLTFSKLSGRALAAHIHTGKVGKAGGVMVPLCGPCRNGQQGRATITHAQLRTIELGRAYVNVHTAKNSAGEIRGQVRSTEIEGSGSNQPPPPPAPPGPTPPPVPYP